MRDSQGGMYLRSDKNHCAAKFYGRQDSKPCHTYLPGDAGLGGLKMDRADEMTSNHNACDEMSEDEKTRLFNAIMEFELPPGVRDTTWTDWDIAEAESPSHLMDDPPYGVRFPEDIELKAQGVYETMFDTLPEMDIILRNECIL